LPGRKKEGRNWGKLANSSLPKNGDDDVGSYLTAFLDSFCYCVVICKTWKQAAHANIQDLRQMVFDMDSEVKISIDKHNIQEQDFKKLGFQVPDTVMNVIFLFFLSTTIKTAGSWSILPRLCGREFRDLGQFRYFLASEVLAPCWLRGLMCPRYVVDFSVSRLFVCLYT